MPQNIMTKKNTACCHDAINCHTIIVVISFQDDRVLLVVYFVTCINACKGVVALKHVCIPLYILKSNLNHGIQPAIQIWLPFLCHMPAHYNIKIIKLSQFNFKLYDFNIFLVENNCIL